MIKKILGALAILLAAVWIYVAYARKNLILPKEVVKARHAPADAKYLQWNGCELLYTDNGSGMPVVMIHGFGGSNFDFSVLDTLVRNAGYRVIRLDLPGFGMSDYPNTPEAKTDLLKTYNDYFNFIIDTLHLDSMYVMGNSMGGMMAWNLTVEHPDKVRKLVLFNSAGYDMKEVQKTAKVDVFRNDIVKVILKRGLPLFMTQRGIKGVFYSQELITPERVQRVNDLWNREGNLMHLVEMVSSDQELDEAKIKTITCPTLIFWGKQDKVVDPKYAERFHQDIANSEMVMYDSCGHVPMMERPIEVRDRVLTFFSKN